MRLLLLVLAGILFAPGGFRNAYSQSAGTHRDRPFQRWLPPPEGSQSNVLDQLRLLEQLRGRMSAESDQSSMPELTESQLQVLDQAYKAWSEQSGGSQLPDWNSIPKEWVDQALSNPDELKQAQRLIEQYARQRKLTLPSSLPGLPQGLKIPGLKMPGGAKPDGSKPDGSKPESSAQQGADVQEADAQGADAQTDPAASGQSQTLALPGSASPSKRAAPRSTRQLAGSSIAQPPRSGSSIGDQRGKEFEKNNLHGDSSSNLDLLGANAQTNAEAGSAQAASKNAPGSSSSTGALDAAKASQLLGAAGNANAGSANEAASKPSVKQPEGLSDGAQLKALRELFETVRAVGADAARQEQAGERGMANGTDRRSPVANSHNNSARKPQISRQANASKENSEALERSALERNARSSANGFKEPMPGAASGQRTTRSMVQPPQANSGRPGASSNLPNSQVARAPNGFSPNSQRPDLVDGESDGSDASSSEAGDSTESGPFDMPPMFESMATTSSGSAPTDGSALSSDALSSDALRSGARGLATERSSAQGMTVQPSASSGPSALSSTDSSSGASRFPELSAELSSRLASVDSQAELQAKIHRDFQQLGFQGALRRIIHDTFKDETKKARPSQARPNESSLSIKLPEMKPSAPRLLKQSASAVRKNMPNFLSDSRVASVFKDVWKAIADAPLSNANSIASAPSGLPVSQSPPQKWKWNGKWSLQGNSVPIVLALVAVAALVVWGSRKRPALFRSEHAIDSRWAKEVLAEGIRTRADVIRAFHRMVSRTSQPVASWWTHRYVARRLTEATPQLAAAMADLSSVYEQARYMPPEAELSPEQISRVCGALRECVTYGNSAANASS